MPRTSAASPKGCIAPEAAFGRALPNTRFWWPEGYSREQVLAALLQHLYSYRVERALAEEMMTKRAFAEEHGVDESRLVAVLRGRIVMDLADVGLFASALGITALVDPEWQVTAVREVLQQLEGNEGVDPSDLPPLPPRYVPARPPRAPGAR